MEHVDNSWLGLKLRHIANEAAELPGLRILGEPLYRRMFSRPSRDGNAYSAGTPATLKPRQPHRLPYPAITPMQAQVACTGTSTSAYA